MTHNSHRRNEAAFSLSSQTNLLEWHCMGELSGEWKYSVPVLSRSIATGHMCLLSPLKCGQ